METKLLILNADSYARSVSERLFSGVGDRIFRRREMETLLENAVLFGEELGASKANESAAEQAQRLASGEGPL